MAPAIEAPGEVPAERSRWRGRLRPPMPRQQAHSRKRAPARGIRRRIALSALVLLLLAPAVATAREPSAERPRFSHLERLYFERLQDPALSPGLRKGGDLTAQDEELRSLLPEELGEGEGPFDEERVVTPSEGPMHFGFAIRDLPLPEALAGTDVFLRQLVNGTHPRIREQFWALYARGRRTDLWFFSPIPDRTDSKLVAPLEILEILESDASSLVLRAEGGMVRPQGAGWFQGVDLVFATGGGELRYRHAVRRYSFSYGYDRGEGRNLLVGVEVPAQHDGRPAVEQHLAFDPPEKLTFECGVDPDLAFPSGGFERMVEIATCITSRPGSVTRWREPEEPTFIERGGEPVAGPRTARGGLPEASMDPIEEAVELCSGHLSGAPLPDGRPGSHITWTLYTTSEPRDTLAARYLDGLGEEGHEADGGCDSWKRPVARPERIVEVCELDAEGPWRDCPPPPEGARSRLLISTMARAD